MRFNKDIEYALIGLTAMEETTDLLSARDISDEFQIPYDLLSKILQKLVTSGVIASVKGAHGGYRLERSPEEVTLGEIINGVHGRKGVAPCLDDTGCVQEEVCNIRDSIQGVQSMWDEFINSMTLRQFARNHAGASRVTVEAKQ